jgi:hypothetical protein
VDLVERKDIEEIQKNAQIMIMKTLRKDEKGLVIVIAVIKITVDLVVQELRNWSL